jgi:hypothetical protein
MRVLPKAGDVPEASRSLHQAANVWLWRQGLGGGSVQDAEGIPVTLPL